MLTPGRRIGPYEITGSLGAGGMGEVYRARDTRLQRDAALKVLPPSLLQDPERRARFEREARVLASLNHPNIAAIYGVEDATGPAGSTPVLILEFVEGQTLADRIAAGRVPLDDAIAIAFQIAEALEAAHERGIIHRDLKPANVQITRGGAVKVLDSAWPRRSNPARTSPWEIRPSHPRLRPDLAHSAIGPAGQALSWASPWARPPTWRRSRREGRLWIAGPTSGRSVRCCSSCCRERVPLRAKPSRTRSPRS